MGLSLFAGEAEDGRFDTVLKDASEGALKPLYNFMSNLPDMNNQPMPILPPYFRLLCEACCGISGHQSSYFPPSLVSGLPLLYGSPSNLAGQLAVELGVARRALTLSKRRRTKTPVLRVPVVVST
jgi:hypothetical protein